MKRSLGTNPDKMDDDAYSASFEAFKSHMFRPPAEETPSAQSLPASERGNARRTGGTRAGRKRRRKWMRG